MPRSQIEACDAPTPAPHASPAQGGRHLSPNTPSDAGVAASGDMCLPENRSLPLSKANFWMPQWSDEISSDVYPQRVSFFFFTII